MTAEPLALGGLVPFSTGDFPGRLAAVVFAQGCPLRCRYCHNPHLRERGMGTLSWPMVTAWLRRRRGLLDGVVVSGGEPTAQAGLADALSDIRALGFDTGLHSSGANPKRLGEVVKLLDWIGLDMKAPFNKYRKVAGSEAAGRRARQSLDTVLASGVAFEIRTTLHASLLSAEDLLLMADELRANGVRNWVLQIFRPTGCQDTELRQFGRADWLDARLPELRALVPNIAIR
jgi:pyruvate formate lyase activating enzyme